MKQIHSYISSKPLRALLYIFGGFAVIFLIFEAGILAGYHRAEFGRRMRHGQGGFSLGWSFPHLLFTDGPGAIGRITDISGDTLTVMERDGSSRSVIFGTSTPMREGNGAASSSALEKGEQIIVIGNPEQNGSIDAAFIRIISTSTGTSTRSTSF